MKVKNVYLCCSKEKKELYQEQARDIYKDYANIVPKLDKLVDVVIAVEPLELLQEAEKKQAEKWGIYVITFTDRFVPKEINKKLLKGD